MMLGMTRTADPYINANLAALGLTLTALVAISACASQVEPTPEAPGVTSEAITDPAPSPGPIAGPPNACIDTPASLDFVYDETLHVDSGKQVLTADINSDGFADALVLQGTEETLQVYLGDGAGKLASPLTFSVNPPPSSWRSPRASRRRRTARSRWRSRT